MGAIQTDKGLSVQVKVWESLFHTRSFYSKDCEFCYTYSSQYVHNMESLPHVTDVLISYKDRTLIWDLSSASWNLNYAPNSSLCMIWLET